MTLSASNTEELLVEQQGYVAIMTLNRPERLNAISRDMLNELSAKMVEADKDPDTRCIVLTGAGRGFCSGLDLDAEVQAKAYELISAAQEKELTSGRGPTGIAASIIYIASVLCGKRRTQREVAEVAGVTEVTIRNRYKELIQNLNIELEI